MRPCAVFARNPASLPLPWPELLMSASAPDAGPVQGASGLAHNTSSEEVRLLLVDDDDAMRSALREVLMLSGYRVAEASTPEEAVALTASFDPVGVLLDLGLPNAERGIALTHLLRTRHGSDLVLVVLTGFTDSSTFRAAAAAGADHFLTKPVDFDKLASIFRPLT